MPSAARRGFSARHSRSVTSASSAAYSVALSIATRAKPMKLRPEPATSAKRDRLVAEPSLAERVHAVAVAGRAGVEHVGDQHGVVERRDLDAVPGEDVPVELHVLADLEHAGASSSGFSSAIASLFAESGPARDRRRRRDRPRPARWPSGM